MPPSTRRRTGCLSRAPPTPWRSIPLPERWWVTFPGQIRSHGTALVPALNRGFITDGGGSGAILVFDLKTYAVLGKLATMPDSDGIIYDPAMNLVLAVSGDGKS